MAEYLCGTYQTEVADNGNSILCDLCDKWHHTICAEVSYAKYEKLKVDLNPWLCLTCAEEISFFALANKDRKNLLSNIFMKKSILKKVDQKTKIHPDKFKELNQVLEAETNTSCDYYEINEFKKLKIEQHDFSLLHLNISSLSSHIDEMVTFLNLPETKFDIISLLKVDFHKKIHPQATSIPLDIILNKPQQRPLLMGL